MGGARPDPLPVRVPAPRGGLGALLGADGERDACASRRSRRPGVRKFYNGPESFTPDNQFLLGAAPEVAELLRRRRLQLRRHRVGRRRRSGAGRVDRRTARRRRTSPPSTSAGSRGSTATTAGCTTGSPRCSGCTTRSRGPTARCGRPGRSGARRSTTCSSRPTRTSAARWAGSGANFFAPPGTAPAIEYTWAKPNWLPWVAAEHANTRTERHRLRPDVVLEVPRRRPRRRARPSSGCARRTSPCRPGAPSTPGCSTPAAPTSRTSPSPGSAPTEFLVVSSAATTERDQDHIRRNLPAGLRRDGRRRDVGATPCSA